MNDYCELANELTLTSINQCLVTYEAVFQALSNLHIENNPFEFYDLGLSDEDKLFLSTVKVAKNNNELIGEFDQENNFFYLKDLKNKSKISLEKLVTCQSKATEDCAEYLSALITSIVYNLLKISGYDDAGIIIRVGNTIEYGWHIDPNHLENIHNNKATIIKYSGNDQSILKALEELNLTAFLNKKYSEVKDQNNYVFIFNLIGDSTLLYKRTPEEKLLIDMDEVEEENFDRSKIFAAQKGHGSTFFIGSKFGTIHSAPKSEKDRLTVLVGPGPSDIINVSLQTSKIAEMIKSTNKTLNWTI